MIFRYLDPWGRVLKESGVSGGIGISESWL